MTYKSNLCDLQSIKIDADGMKIDGWRRNGILVIAVDDTRLGWDERQLVMNLGNRLYGELKNGCA